MSHACTCRGVEDTQGSSKFNLAVWHFSFARHLHYLFLCQNIMFADVYSITFAITELHDYTLSLASSLASISVPGSLTTPSSSSPTVLPDVGSSESSELGTVRARFN